MKDLLSRTAWPDLGSDGKVCHRVSSTPEDPPYDTRAVFADYDGVDLESAAEVSNYIGTRWAPSESP